MVAPKQHEFELHELVMLVGKQLSIHLLHEMVMTEVPVVPEVLFLVQAAEAVRELSLQA